MFRKIFSFTGRIRRLEFVLTAVILVIINLHTGYLASLEIPVNEEDKYDIRYNPKYNKPSGWFVLVQFLLFWITLAQAVKRCHDLKHPAYYLMIPFYIFVLLFVEGTNGPNEYGEDLKGLKDTSFDEDPTEDNSTIS